ncbi:MAG: hypothetical protein JXB88_24525 [Spirochaetales bacterium]|nr:hypothetical protein [Spirochaetales bacterium]
MKKRKVPYTLIIVSMIVVFILCTIYSSEDEVIGIVLTFKGNLILDRGDSTKTLIPGDRVYRDSLIKLEEETGRGKVQIGSDAGPVIYTRFPVNFKTTSFKPIPPEKQDNYISCVGGTVLTSRSLTLFDWFMNTLGALDKKDIGNGFSVVLSKNKNSSENLSLDPLYFRIKDDVQIQSISGKLVNKDEDSRVEVDAMVIEKKNKDWIIALDQYDYEYAVEYAVKATITLMNNKKENFEFSFYVYGEEEIKFIEAEAEELYPLDNTDFGKAIIRAGRYRYYEMHLKGMSILKEAGIDIDGML